MKPGAKYQMDIHDSIIVESFPFFKVRGCPLNDDMQILGILDPPPPPLSFITKITLPLTTLSPFVIEHICWLTPHP